MFIRRKRIMAEDEIDTMGGGDVAIDPQATDLLFETEDVAELVSEVTGEDVEVTIDDEADTVTFGVGDDEYQVTPDGDEEILESTNLKLRNKRSVKASTRQSARRRRPICSNTRAVRRTSRRIR